MKQDNNTSGKRRSTYAMIFYIDRDKTKKNGMCPVMGRITIDKSKAQFSTKIDVNPDLWDGKTGRSKGNSRESGKINNALERLEKKIRGYYEEISFSQGYVTAELIKNALKGIGKKEEMLLKLFAEHNEEFMKRIGVNRVQDTYYHYTLSYRHLYEFLLQKYELEDIPIRRLNLPFIDAYDFYLRVDKQMSQHTISGHMITLKKIVRRAVNQGTLRCDPFFHYIPEQPERNCRHLKAEEIEKIMQVYIESKRVRHTRDMFVFSCFTGLAYVDLSNLSDKHLRTEADGSLWICINRQKTGSESNIRLLDIPKQIIEKYSHERKSDKIFNTVSLACVCRNLKVIAKLCGIKHITFHMARHNFGTHITLSQGVPIETVSRMMGHGSITTTQIYAKITNQKVNEDMKLLSGKIADPAIIFIDDIVSHITDWFWYPQSVRSAVPHLQVCNRSYV